MIIKRFKQLFLVIIAVLILGKSTSTMQGPPLTMTQSEASNLLWTSCREKNIEKAREAIRHGADSKQTCSVKISINKTIFEVTTLMVAIMPSYNVETNQQLPWSPVLVKCLLDSGVEVNAEDSLGRTILNYVRLYFSQSNQSEIELEIITMLNNAEASIGPWVQAPLPQTPTRSTSYQPQTPISMRLMRGAHTPEPDDTIPGDAPRRLVRQGAFRIDRSSRNREALDVDVDQAQLLAHLEAEEEWFLADLNTDPVPPFILPWNLRTRQQHLLIPRASRQERIPETSEIDQGAVGAGFTDYAATAFFVAPKEKCVICQDTLQEDDQESKRFDQGKIVIAKCKHAFHASCLNQMKASGPFMTLKNEDGLTVFEDDPERSGKKRPITYLVCPICKKQLETFACTIVQQARPIMVNQKQQTEDIEQDEMKPAKRRRTETIKKKK